MVLSLFRRRHAGSFGSVSGLPAALLIGAAVLATGCHSRITDPKDPKFIVAEKGDWHYTRADLDKEVGTLLKQNQKTPEQIGPKEMPEIEVRILENVVLKKLLLDKAATMQLKDVDKDEAAALTQLKGPGTDLEFEEHLKAAGITLDDLKKRIHEKILITKVVESEVGKDADPSEQEIDAIYTANKEHFVTPPQVRASRVLVLLPEKISPADKAKKKVAIDKARARVAKGEEFRKVAGEVSEDQFSKTRGGDVSWFKRGENEPQFDEVAFGSKEGVLSPVFETPMGYQFIKVTGTQPGGPLPLADVRTFITGKLRQKKMTDLQAAYCAKILKDGGATIYLQHPPKIDAPPSQAPGMAQAPGNVPPPAPEQASVPPAGASPASTNSPAP